MRHYRVTRYLPISVTLHAPDAETARIEAETHFAQTYDRICPAIQVFGFSDEEPDIHNGDYTSDLDIETIDPDPIDPALVEAHTGWDDSGT